MPKLINYIDHYLYTNKKDTFILSLKNQGNSIIYDKYNADNIKTEELKLQWFQDHNIIVEKTNPMGLISGWDGHYYVGFENWDDPVLKLYSDTFENPDGSSKDPTKYQMLCINYDSWVNNGKLEQYEQFLQDLENPDFEF
jgi:hypothetical protein